MTSSLSLLQNAKEIKMKHLQETNLSQLTDSNYHSDEAKKI